MNLDPVEARDPGIGCRATIILDGASDLSQAKCPGLGNIDESCLNDRLSVRPYRRRRYRRYVPWQQAAMGDPAHVPQLEKDSSARLVYCIDDGLPTGDLFFRVNAWSVDVTLAHGRNLGRLRDDQ